MLQTNYIMTMMYDPCQEIYYEMNLLMVYSRMQQLLQSYAENKITRFHLIQNKRCLGNFINIYKLDQLGKYNESSYHLITTGVHKLRYRHLSKLTIKFENQRLRRRKKCNLTLAVSPTCPLHQPSAYLFTFSVRSQLRIGRG